VVGEHRQRITEEERRAVGAKEEAQGEADQAVKDAEKVRELAEAARQEAEQAASEAERAKGELQTLREDADKWKWEHGRLQAALANFVQLHEKLESEKATLTAAEEEVARMQKERESKLHAVISSTKGGHLPAVAATAAASSNEGSDDYVPEEAAGSVQGGVFPILGSSDPVQPPEILVTAAVTAAEKRAMERRGRNAEAEPESDPEPLPKHEDPYVVPSDAPALESPGSEPESASKAEPTPKKKKKLPQGFMSM